MPQESVWEGLARYIYAHERMVRQDYPPFDDLPFREATARIRVAEGEPDPEVGCPGWFRGAGQLVDGRDGLLLGPKEPPEDVILAGRAMILARQTATKSFEPWLPVTNTGWRGPRSTWPSSRGPARAFQHFRAATDKGMVIHLMDHHSSCMRLLLSEACRIYGVDLRDPPEGPEMLGLAAP